MNLEAALVTDVDHIPDIEDLTTDADGRTQGAVGLTLNADVPTRAEDLTATATAERDLAKATVADGPCTAAVMMNIDPHLLSIECLKSYKV